MNESLEKKMIVKMEEGSKNEENARQLVQSEIDDMTGEIKNLKMGSGSTVCSEASTGVGLGSGTSARPSSDSKENGIQGVGHRFHAKEQSGDY